jgi:hypothetical protein
MKVYTSDEILQKIKSIQIPPRYKEKLKIPGSPTLYDIGIVDPRFYGTF